MKDKLYEFYKLPSQKINDIWEHGILIVDTNVLLDLYRLGKESRNDLKKSIDYFGDRIWLPYQTSLEFHRNRENVIKELGGSKYDEFVRLLKESIVPDLKNSFKTYQRHPCIDYNYIEKCIDRFSGDLEKKVEPWKKAYPFDPENDDVLKWVTDKYQGKVGDDNAIEELLNIFKEGEVRYRANVPPGYKDANDKDKKEAGLRYVYGDLIIWKSVIAKAKLDKVDILFLTNDNKEDWYEKYKGQTKGPRFELFREFHKETEQDLIIMTEASFLKEMKEKKSVKVKDSSIEDAQRAINADVSFDWLKSKGFTSPVIESMKATSMFSNSIIGSSGIMADYNTLMPPGLTVYSGYDNLASPRLTGYPGYDPMASPGLTIHNSHNPIAPPYLTRYTGVPDQLVDPETGLINTSYFDSFQDGKILHKGKKNDKEEDDFKK